MGDDRSSVCGSRVTRGKEVLGYLDAAGQSAAETALRAQVWARQRAAVQDRGGLGVQTAVLSVGDDKSSVCGSRGTRGHELWGPVRAPSPSRVGRGPVTRLNRCTAESHAYSMPGRDAAASLISSPSLVQDRSRIFIDYSAQ